MSINTLSTNNEILSQLRKTVGGVLVYSESAFCPIVTANIVSMYQTLPITTPQEAGYSIIRCSFTMFLNAPNAQASLELNINGSTYLQRVVFLDNTIPLQVIGVFKVPTSATPPNSIIAFALNSNPFVLSNGQVFDCEVITYIT
jgi:hypothetical protein